MRLTTEYLIPSGERKKFATFMLHKNKELDQRPKFNPETAKEKHWDFWRQTRTFWAEVQWQRNKQAPTMDRMP